MCDCANHVVSGVRSSPHAYFDGNRCGDRFKYRWRTSRAQTCPQGSAMNHRCILRQQFSLRTVHVDSMLIRRRQCCNTATVAKLCGVCVKPVHWVLAAYYKRKTPSYCLSSEFAQLFPRTLSGLGSFLLSASRFLH